MINTTAFFRFLLVLILFSATQISAAESSPQFVQGSDTLIVYTDVPDLEPSEFYTIRVRSAASNNEWVDCFANITRNRAYLQEPHPKGDNRNYSLHTDGWSHTYANIEMSKNSAVEVEISAKNGFKINGQDFFKATAHPSHKASLANVSEGKVYFTINNPASLTIDINGQLDDYELPSIVPGVKLKDVDPDRPRVHTITIFAHPIMDKPSVGDPNVVFAEPGLMPSSDLGSKTILYFKPGVHDIGLGFKLQPGKKYYIPGDAVVYGTMNNIGVEGSGGLSSGENIKIYGLGTLSGDKLNHPNFDFVYDPSGDEEKPYKPISIDNATNSGVEGVCVANGAFHSVYLNGTDSYCKWAKAITWRGNGDGFGNVKLMEDCFLRTADDCTYIKGNKRRCVFWKDSNAAVFHIPNIPEDDSFVIEDCDVLYLRAATNASRGDGVFVQRTQGEKGQRPVNVLFKDIRIHDKYPNVPIFNLASHYAEFDDKPDHRFYGVGSSYKGITFRNITAVTAYDAYGTDKSEQILGHAEAPWYGGIIFDSVFIAGEQLTNLDRFKTNQYVEDILFRMPEDFTLSTNTNDDKGTIIIYPALSVYEEFTKVTLTAKAKPGYSFSNWSGDTSGTSNPITIKMDGNKTITANFTIAEIKEPIVIDTPGSGTLTIPEGIKSATIKAWGGGGAGGSAANGDLEVQTRGGGGGGGSFANVTIMVSPGQILNYTAGAGGIAPETFTHQSVDAVQNGGSSFVILNEVTIVSALGGTGGENISGTVGFGNGGVAPQSGNSGDVVFYGGNGATATPGGTGGGGGSAGSEGNGGDAPNPVTGNAPGGAAGKGGGAVGGEGSNKTLDGNMGSSPGAGGSGAAVRVKANNSRSGGKGADGMLIITFIADTFNLTTDAENGSIKLSPPGGVYEYGTVVTLTSTPNEGYQFSAWSGDLSGNENPASITMNSNKTVTALMTQIPSYSLTLNATNGVINLDPEGGTYIEGTEVTLTASPDEGYEFLEWTGDLSASINPTTITMDADKNITAVFDEVTSVNGLSSFNTSSMTILEQMYPNPFSLNTTIPYHLSEATYVKLSIYNSLGQLVSVLVKEHQEAGHYKVDWYPKDTKGNRLPKGIYICQLETNNYSLQTKKIVLLKH